MYRLYQKDATYEWYFIVQYSLICAIGQLIQSTCYTTGHNTGFEGYYSWYENLSIFAPISEFCLKLANFGSN